MSEVDSRRLVSEAMLGRAPRIPLYFWLADPELEASVGDMVGVRCWFKRLDFLEKGGPFAKGKETRREWCDRLQPDEYDWPTPESLTAEMDETVAKTLKIDRRKSFQLEIIGPTEYSEYSCSPGKTAQSARLDQVSHQFDFSVLTLLDARKANMIHWRFFDLLLEAAKRATEYEMIDSIRISDDFCSYTGSVYRPDFTENLVRRQVELGQAITRRGKYPVLHSDGDIEKHLAALAQGYSGFHPLDLRSKSTVADAHAWATSLAAVRCLLPESIFFTGIPVDLLCNLHVSSEELAGVAEHVIETVGRDRLILTTTHRPYPGCGFRDFEQKAYAIRRLVQTIAASTAWR